MIKEEINYIWNPKNKIFQGKMKACRSLMELLALTNKQKGHQPYLQLHNTITLMKKICERRKPKRTTISCMSYICTCKITLIQKKRREKSNEHVSGMKTSKHKFSRTQICSKNDSTFFAIQTCIIHVAKLLWTMAAMPDTILIMNFPSITIIDLYACLSILLLFPRKGKEKMSSKRNDGASEVNIDA